MAPRIRLNLSKPLPTIRESHEEAMEDSASNLKHTGITAASSDSYSSDDYIQSICHLARPTFPSLPERSCKVWDRKTLNTFEDVSWSPNFGAQETSECKLTNLISNVVPLGKATSAEANFWSREDPLAQIYTCAGKFGSSKSSFYGKSSSTGYSQCNSFTRNGEVHPPTMKEKATGKTDFPQVFGFPRLRSPRPMQKEAVCSELKYLRRDEGAVLGSIYSQKENSPTFVTGEERSSSSARGKLVGNPVSRCSVGRQSCLFNTAGTAEKEGRETSHCDKNVTGDALTKQCFQVPGKAMFHNWISEHRFIWKEAKVKACLLPAIAEV